MADYYASIFGTEKDKVNCSFYFKIGACRHGDRCSRVHNKPTFSQTILIQNLYVNPQNSAKAQGDGKEVTDEEDQRHFDEFFEDIYVELEEKYGPIEEMNVCDNLGDHLIGNVYVKFKREEDAERAVEDLNNRWFAGKPVYAELSTVTDFREAGCRQYEVGACTRVVEDTGQGAVRIDHTYQGQDPSQVQDQNLVPDPCRARDLAVDSTNRRGVLDSGHPDLDQDREHGHDQVRL